MKNLNPQKQSFTMAKEDISPLVLFLPGKEQKEGKTQEKIEARENSEANALAFSSGFYATEDIESVAIARKNIERPEAMVKDQKRPISPVVDSQKTFPEKSSRIDRGAVEERHGNVEKTKAEEGFLGNDSNDKTVLGESFGPINQDSNEEKTEIGEGFVRGSTVLDAKKRDGFTEIPDLSCVISETFVERDNPDNPPEDTSSKTVSLISENKPDRVSKPDRASLTVPLQNAGDFTRHKSKATTKYSVIREIGRGGMGKVDLWKDNYLQRVIASKTLLRSQNASSESVRRFWEEGQIAGQLEHPNIISIHDLGVDQNGHLFFTMKYVRGRSLQQIIDELKSNPKKGNQEWSLQKMVQIFQTICYAMDYAHSKNVIHRDLKPDNIMLGNFGEVIVMDWGLAKVLGKGEEILSEDTVTTLSSQGGFKTISGQIVGTPRYMSPEQARGDLEKMDHRSDIYSLGIILYKMVTGKDVVHKTQVMEIVLDISRGRISPVPKKGLFGPIPKELKCIIQKAMRFSPENRYQSAREMAQDLQNFLELRPVSCCHYTLFERFNKMLRRKGKEITLVLVTSFILIVAFTVWEYCTRSQHAHSYLEKVDKIFQSPQVVQSIQFFEQGANANPALKQSYYNILKEAIEQSTEECHAGYDRMKCAVCQRTLLSFEKKEADLWLRYYKASQKMGDKAGMEKAIQRIKSVVPAIVFQNEYERILQKPD